MKKERFLILLVSLLVYIVLSPVMSPYSIGARVLDVVWLILFFSCINAISDTRGRFVIAVLLFACSAAARLAINFTDDGYYNLFSRASEFALSAVFATYIGFLIIGYVMSEGKVTRDKLAAAICVYLIIGTIWGNLFGLVATLDPGALGAGFAATEGGRGLAIYYSYITLTTVGYGDITPLSPMTRSLAIVEGITGQIYIAVTIARLVGLYTVHSTHKTE